MLAKSYRKLSGKSHDQKYFRFKESSVIALDHIFEVLKGEILGSITHNAISLQDCKTVSRNFWESDIAKHRNDGVPAISMGAYHYKKSLSDYFSQIEQFQPHVDNLFNGANNFIKYLLDVLTAYFLNKGIIFRLARYNERDASPFVLRSCNSISDFVISPHDDVAQCRTILQ
ncbi:MAG: hypothetical protein JO149_03165, partial [Gammaproteobacteria bacterium]|nr:hypothetical protein [Gammaproteobacteria bacterium]